MEVIELDGDSVVERPSGRNFDPRPGCHVITLDESVEVNDDVGAALSEVASSIAGIAPNIFCDANVRRQRTAERTDICSRQSRQMVTETSGEHVDEWNSNEADDVLFVDNSGNPGRRSRTTNRGRPTRGRSRTNTSHVEAAYVVNETSSSVLVALQDYAAYDEDLVETVHVPERDIVDLTGLSYREQVRPGSRNGAHGVVGDHEVIAVPLTAPTTLDTTSTMFPEQQSHENMTVDTRGSVAFSPSSRNGAGTIDRSRTMRAVRNTVRGVASSARITRSRTRSALSGRRPVASDVATVPSRLPPQGATLRSHRVPSSREQYFGERFYAFAFNRPRARHVVLLHPANTTRRRGSRASMNATDDFFPMSYEDLLQLDERIDDRQRAAPENLINNLPLRVASAADTERSCCICLCDVSPGEELRILPCTHQFHKDCVDTWLRRNGCCPVDKIRVDSLEAMV